MNLKKALILGLTIILTDVVLAQTQVGIVKTIGRPGKPGVALENVVVQVKGMTNAVLTDKAGGFRIPMPDKKKGDPIVILRVAKNGYELQDRNSLGRQQVFSPDVPIYILMVNQQQLAEDKRRIEEKAYQVAEENYQKKISILETQLNEKTLSSEHYQQELAKLQQQYESYLSLVGDMAERYARTDYDQLDSIDREINLCIENGELDKADSLIHTVFDPETVLERNRAAKEEINSRMAFAREVIDKAMSDREALLRDRSYAERILALCLEMVDEYITRQATDDALRCLQLALTVQTSLYGETSDQAVATKQRIEKLSNL